MSFLCRFGLHKWRDLGSVGIVMRWSVRQCQRCERGREIGWTGTIHYTPEQMRAALAGKDSAHKAQEESK